MFIFFISCSSDNHPLAQEETGSIPLKMSIKPALDLGFNVSRVQVIIQKDTFRDSMNLLINAEECTAAGEFNELSPGLYSISVKVFEDSLLIATGMGQGQVLPGQNSIVQINLQLVPGSLTINVDWGDLNPDFPDYLLFIGNSYTYYNNGLWSIVKQMVETAHSEMNVAVGHVCPGGYTLEEHYQLPETLNAIKSGLYDVVILQEQSVRPVYEPDMFYRYV